MPLRPSNVGGLGQIPTYLADLVSVGTPVVVATLWQRGARIAAVLFGLVAFHVVLTEGQLQLDRLQQRATDQRDEYDHLRLQVAQLEAVRLEQEKDMADFVQKMREISAARDIAEQKARNEIAAATDELQEQVVDPGRAEPPHDVPSPVATRHPDVFADRERHPRTGITVAAEPDMELVARALGGPGGDACERPPARCAASA